MAKQTDCLHSVVRNISGETLTFSFLPPHGVTLDDNEEYEMFGRVAEAIQRACEGPSDAALKLLAFQNALQDAVMEIVREPNPILYDEDEEASAMLVYDEAGAQMVPAQMCTQLDGGDDSEDDIPF